MTYIEITEDETSIDVENVDYVVEIDESDIAVEVEDNPSVTIEVTEDNPVIEVSDEEIIVVVEETLSSVVTVDNGPHFFTLGQLTDVTITNPQDQDAIYYDSGTSTWLNGDKFLRIDGTNMMLADLNMNDFNVVNIGHISFDIDHVPEGETAGTSYWDAENDTMSTTLLNGVVGQWFEEDFIPVQNDTGDTVVDGMVATYGGGIGNSGNIRMALTVAAADENPILTLGVVTQDIVNGGTGKVTTRGKVRGIQTDGANYSETWLEGQILYKSPTVAGGLTNVEPQAPIPAIPLAVVVSPHATNGTLLVRPTFPQSLKELTDVNGTPVDTNGQILVWNNDDEVFDFDFNINDYLLADSFIEGSVLFRGSALITEDNNNFFYNDAANKLEVTRLLVGNGVQQSGSTQLEIVELGAANASFSVINTGTGGATYTMTAQNGGGDIFTKYFISGVVNYFVGVDQTDRAFKIAGTTLGAGRDYFKVANGGGVTINMESFDRTGLIIKSFSSQTLNLQEWQDSSGNVINVVDKDFNVGIGTSSPSQALDIKGNLRLEDESSTDTVALIANSGDDGWITLYQNTVAKVHFHSNSDSYINGGNFGIGIALPQTNLHIKDSLDVGLTLEGGSGGDYKMTWKDDVTTFWEMSAESSAYPLVFKSGGTDVRMVMAQNGNVGIGPDGTPNELLDVQGSIRADDIIYSLSSSGNNYFLGNVGIGTNSPLYKLEVDETTVGILTVANFKHQQASVISNVIFQNSAGADNTGFNLNFKTGAAGYGGVIGVLRTNSPNAGDADMFLSSGGGEAIRIKHAGNVGIGTATPDTRLEIDGALTINELSADPTDPAEGKAVFWKSDGTDTGDDGDLLYKEQSAGVVANGSLKWKDFSPSSITLNTGTLISGDVTDVQTMFDGNVYHVDEVTGVPGYDIEFNFTNVDRVPTFVVVRWIYDGSSTHYSTWDIWNYRTASWDQLRMFKTSEGFFNSMTMYIPRNSNGDYVSGGNSKVRTFHHTSGNASHDIQIDYVGLTHSLQGVI